MTFRDKPKNSEILAVGRNIILVIVIVFLIKGCVDIFIRRQKTVQTLENGMSVIVVQTHITNVVGIIGKTGVLVLLDSKFKFIQSIKRETVSVSKNKRPVKILNP